MIEKAKAKPTIQDIARECGLTISSVSKALNYPENHPAVSKATRQRVLEKARELNYQPNWQAKALASAKTRTIGMVFFDRIPRIMGVNEYIVVELEKLFGAQDYHAVFLPVDRNAGAYERLLHAGRADAYLLFSSGPGEFVALANQLHYPVAVINGYARGGKALSLAYNDRQGAYDAVVRLLKLGHERIGYFAESRADPAGHYSYIERLEGVRKAMETEGDPAQLCLYEGMHVEEMVDRYRGADQPPTAMLFHNHYRAVEAFHALWEKGVRVPQDISLITFNDSYPVKYMTPPLAAVSLPEPQMAQAAFFAIMDALENGAGYLEGQVVFDEVLMMRESVARR